MYSPVKAVSDLHRIGRDALAKRLRDTYTTEQHKMALYFTRLNQQSRVLHRCKIIEKIRILLEKGD